ncbi:MAG TPA: hypothetical protein VMV77_05770 [Bacteroidales bacterium]|nr:hypothetical protein [Bacteroidales bacterium]
MKKQLFIFLVVVLSSCATVRESSLPEDELFLTRKYIGNFIEYRHTSPERLGDPHIIWIKTTIETYGKISAYSKECSFSEGDRLFIRRTYYMPGGWSGYWMYQIESDKSVSYRLSEFQYDNKLLVQTWF